jgi:hypothetical protein
MAALARSLRACFVAPTRRACRSLSSPAAAGAAAAASSPSAPASAPASAAPAPPAPRAGFLAVLLRELREQLTPMPNLPGVVNTTLLDPPAWRAHSAAEVELAFKLALWMSVTDFRNLLALLTGRPTTFERGEARAEPPPPPPPREQQGAGAAAAGGPPSPAALAVAQALARAPSPADVRGAALQAAAQLSSLSRDEELRRRLAAMGSEALNLTRDCLDEFLAGYEVRSRVARASRAAPALTPLALTASL